MNAIEIRLPVDWAAVGIVPPGPYDESCGTTVMTIGPSLPEGDRWERFVFRRHRQARKGDGHIDCYA